MMVTTRFIVVLLLVTITSIVVLNQSVNTITVYAKSSPYKSGYNHGCDDAGISDSGDRYINNPKKGPAHTQEFMSGYHEGFMSCGSQDKGNGNFGGNANGGTLDASTMKGYVKDFCAAQNRGDYADAEDLLALLPLPYAGSAPAAVKVFCKGTNFLDNILHLPW